MTVDSFKKTLKLPPKEILPNIMAGLIAGVVALPYCVSYASLIFAGELSNYLSIGIGSALVCTIVSSVITAFGSSFAFAVIGPDPNSSVILLNHGGDRD